MLKNTAKSDIRFTGSDEQLKGLSTGPLHTSGSLDINSKILQINIKGIDYYLNAQEIVQFLKMANSTNAKNEKSIEVVKTIKKFMKDATKISANSPQIHVLAAVGIIAHAENLLKYTNKLYSLIHDNHTPVDISSYKTIVHNTAADLKVADATTATAATDAAATAATAATGAATAAITAATAAITATGATTVITDTTIKTKIDSIIKQIKSENNVIGAYNNLIISTTALILNNLLQLVDEHDTARAIHDSSNASDSKKSAAAARKLETKAALKSAKADKNKAAGKQHFKISANATLTAIHASIGRIKAAQKKKVVSIDNNDNKEVIKEVTKIIVAINKLNTDINPTGTHATQPTSQIVSALILEATTAAAAVAATLAAAATAASDADKVADINAAKDIINTFPLEIEKITKSDGVSKYAQKYQKYKQKYLQLKAQYGL